MKNPWFYFIPTIGWLFLFGYSVVNPHELPGMLQGILCVFSLLGTALGIACLIDTVTEEELISVKEIKRKRDQLKYIKDEEINSLVERALFLKKDRISIPTEQLRQETVKRLKINEFDIIVEKNITHISWHETDLS